MESTMELANSPVMWILATLIVSVVIFQTIVFYKLAKNYVKDTNILTDKEIKIALKVGAVGTIGPAVAVFTVAVVLIGLIGGPITLSRVGVIGSAAFESLAASVGSAGTAGTLDFTPSMLATASWVMTLGGSGWLISTFLLTKKLDSTQEKIKKSNPKIILYIGSFTPLMVFFVYATQESVKGIQSGTYSILGSVIAGAVGMLALNKLASLDKKMDGLESGQWDLQLFLLWLLDP